MAAKDVVKFSVGWLVLVLLLSAGLVLGFVYIVNSGLIIDSDSLFPVDYSGPQLPEATSAESVCSNSVLGLSLTVPQALRCTSSTNRDNATGRMTLYLNESVLILTNSLHPSFCDPVAVNCESRNFYSDDLIDLELLESSGRAQLYGYVGQGDVLIYSDITQRDKLLLNEILLQNILTTVKLQK